jgi:quercetin dioxygenase-like cupin family protein
MKALVVKEFGGPLVLETILLTICHGLLSWNHEEKTMPTIFESNDLPVRNQAGVAYTTLANAAMLGTDALGVERVILEAGKNSEPVSAVDAERFVYVIQGSGQAQVGGEAFPLAPESMLWIEPGDTFTLEAGADGLEVLVCQAPAKTADKRG